MLSCSFPVNCDKNTPGYNRKDDRHGGEPYQNLEEKVEEELGSHAQLCKCGSNSEICEEFINSFSLQDILSNFELPSSSSTDEDDESSTNKKQNEDEEELNLIDFLNNTQFLNDFVNKNSIKIDQVCINSNTVDLITKSNRKKKNLVEDNHQNLHDNQNKVFDNQALNVGTENQLDNQNETNRKLNKKAIPHDDRDPHLVLDKQDESFANEESSSELSVHSENDSQSDSCANYKSTGQDSTLTIPLPSFDTFKSKNVKKIHCQLANTVDNNVSMKENIKTAINKCIEMFHKYQNYNEQALPKQEDKIVCEDDEQSIMGINITEQIDEFERYTEEPSILEHMLSNNRYNVPCTSIVKQVIKDVSDESSKSESQQFRNIEREENIIPNGHIARSNYDVRTEVNENVQKIIKESIISISNTKSQLKPTLNQYEEVIDSGNFWVTKNTNDNIRDPIPLPTTRGKLNQECISTPNVNSDVSRIPVCIKSSNKRINGVEYENDENNIKKSVKILTKTHLLNSMQFDKNQRNFINSPHFLLLLTKPIKFPGPDTQCCNKQLSPDTKTKLINLQNNIRAQIRNAQLLRNKIRPSVQEYNHNLDHQETSSALLQENTKNENASVENGEIYNQLSKNDAQAEENLKSMFSQKKTSYSFHGLVPHDPKSEIFSSQQKSKVVDFPDVKNHQNVTSQSGQTNCKELSNLIKKAENFRFDQEFKILTLRTENADCINRKVKFQKINTVDTKSDIKPTVKQTKLKTKLREEKIRHHNHHHHHYHHHEKIEENENDPTLRRSERIRLKKQRKRMKRCLLSNVKKIKQSIKQRISMSLVDQHLHLKIESEVKINCEDSGENSGNDHDLITYKSCYIEEETINNQKIKKLKYISNDDNKSESIQTKEIESIPCETKQEESGNTKQSSNEDIDEVNSKTDKNETVIVDDKNQNCKTNEKKPTSLKSKYPTLEALIASTSNEVKPIIRKRKRIKFDKSKYEKIKKINKEKENNIEQNKILLLNLNKNVNSKVMQNLLLIRDQNNKTHLLFTKPIENDKVKIVAEQNMSLEQETKMIKLNENNPNYINKKIEELEGDTIQQKCVVINKTNEKSTSKDSNSDPLLTAPNLMDGNQKTAPIDGKEVDVNEKSKESEKSTDLQFCQNIHLESKIDSPNFSFMNHNMKQIYAIKERKNVGTQMQDVINCKSMNTKQVATEISTQNYTSQGETYNMYGYYSISQEYDVNFNRHIVHNNSKVSKSFETENVFVNSTETLTIDKFSDMKETPGPSYYDQNSSLSLKDGSSLGSVPAKICAYKISNRFNQDFSISKENGVIMDKKEYSYENRHCQEMFENDINQLYPSNFINDSNTMSWESENTNYNLSTTILQNNLNTATNSKENKTYESVMSPNQTNPNLPILNKDSNRLQNAFQGVNSKFSNEHSKLFESQMVADTTSPYLGGDVSTLNISDSQGTPQSHLPSMEHSSVYLNVSNSTLEKNPVSFSENGMDHLDDTPDQSFRNMFGGDEVCWESTNSGWSNNGFNQNTRTASNDIYAEHLQLSEEIMKKSLQEDEKVS